MAVHPVNGAAPPPGPLGRHSRAGSAHPLINGSQTLTGSETDGRDKARSVASANPHNADERFKRRTASVSVLAEPNAKYGLKQDPDIEP